MKTHTYSLQFPRWKTVEYETYSNGSETVSLNTNWCHYSIFLKVRDDDDKFDIDTVLANENQEWKMYPHEFEASSNGQSWVDVESENLATALEINDRYQTLLDEEGMTGCLDALTSDGFHFSSHNVEIECDENESFPLLVNGVVTEESE